jgi:hypothetical protein
LANNKAIEFLGMDILFYGVNYLDSVLCKTAIKLIIAVLVVVCVLKDISIK